MRPVIGYPVILTGNESSLHWGNASLIAHQGDSMQDLSGASQQHAANSGQVKKLVPYVDPLVSLQCCMDGSLLLCIACSCSMWGGRTPAGAWCRKLYAAEQHACKQLLHASR